MSDVPARVYRSDEDDFIAPDVAAFVRALEGPLFSYRMTRGQLSRLGMPRQLRRYEAELRAVVRDHVKRLDFEWQREQAQSERKDL
jgi:hypothetical protein